MRIRHQNRTNVRAYLLGRACVAWIAAATFCFHPLFALGQARCNCNVSENEAALPTQCCQSVATSCCSNDAKPSCCSTPDNKTSCCSSTAKSSCCSSKARDCSQKSCGKNINDGAAHSECACTSCQCSDSNGAPESPPAVPPSSEIHSPSVVVGPLGKWLAPETSESFVRTDRSRDSAYLLTAKELCALFSRFTC